MINDTLNEADAKMKKAVEVTREDFAAIRTGRANPSMFHKLVADYYGTPTPLQQLASFTAPEPRVIIVAPYDMSAMTAIAMGQVAEPYIPRRAMRHLDKGRVVIFGAGAGMPYFSTDTVAAQRALEIHAQVILMGKQGVDGVYDSDPKNNPDAVKFDAISYDEFLTRGLQVADATSVSLCRDNDMNMIVFNLSDEGNIARVVSGEKIGTTVARDA